MISKDQYIGIYGLLEIGEKLLLIRKSRGPYTGLLDLPGGSPCYGEPLPNALRREMKEETGIETFSYSLFANFSFLIPYQDSKGNQKELYHIALIYQLSNADFKNFNSMIMDQDVNGSLWLNWQEVRRERSSPLLKKVLESYEK